MNIYLKTFLVFVVLFCVPGASFAAQISFDAKGNQFMQGEDFIVSVRVDTEGKSINAIAGSINFPTNLVDIKEIRDGNSVVSFWLEKPYVSKPGVVRFAGVTPGGFEGPHNSLFSVVLRSTGVGNDIIYGTMLQSFLNDGVGTKLQIKNESLPIIVSAEGILDSFKPNIILEDRGMPESFTPVIARNSDIFNGKYFLVFATQDKYSGVDYYKVREGVLGFYVDAKSPYLLQNQSLTQSIYVKAVDKAGNERIEMLNPENKHTTYQNYIIIAIIFIIITSIIFVKKIWLKYIK
jgi:hypothetical protein